MKKLFYRGTHQYSFRTGEWAIVIGMSFDRRQCFIVEYPDGFRDYVAIIDVNNYELKEE